MTHYKEKLFMAGHKHNTYTTTCGLIDQEDVSVDWDKVNCEDCIARRDFERQIESDKKLIAKYPIKYQIFESYYSIYGEPRFEPIDGTFDTMEQAHLYIARIREEQKYNKPACVILPVIL